MWRWSPHKSRIRSTNSARAIHDERQLEPPTAMSGEHVPDMAELKRHQLPQNRYIPTVAA